MSTNLADLSKRLPISKLSENFRVIIGRACFLRANNTTMKGLEQEYNRVGHKMYQPKRKFITRADYHVIVRALTEHDKKHKTESVSKFKFLVEVEEKTNEILKGLGT